MTRDPLRSFLRDLDRLHQAFRMYPRGHQQVDSAARLAAASLAEWGRPVRMSFLGKDLLIEDRSALNLDGRLTPLATLMKSRGWEGVRIDPACGPEDLLIWLTHSYGAGEGAYAAGGIVAGRLDLGGAGDGEGTDRWPGGYPDYLPDVNRALKDLAAGHPESLEEARRIVHDIFSRKDATDHLLEVVRKLKKFDDYTFTHALNVSILCIAVAKALGLPSDLIQVMGLAGLCHDVGKDRVPEEVLHKPGVLSTQERAIMSRHAAEGAEILLNLPSSVHPLLTIVAYQHHMNPDGSGYPPPLGETLPHPASLLVQVADVFDALRTDRPYRGILSETQAVNLMLADAARGKLERRFVGALLQALGVLQVGRLVELTDGRTAVVRATGSPEALDALVESDDGEILDLTDPTVLCITALRERAAT